MKSSEQNPKHNKPNQDQTNKEGNNTQNDFSASSQDITPQNNKEGNNIRIEDNSTGLDYLREELKDRNRAIREKDNQVKELYQLLLKKNQQHPYTVLVAAILICLAIIFTTHRQDNQTTKTAYIAQSQPTSQDTSIYTKRLIKKLQKSNKKSHEASVKRIRIKPKHNPKDFKPNEMLEERIGKTKLLKPAGKHKRIIRIVSNIILQGIHLLFRSKL